MSESTGNPPKFSFRPYFVDSKKMLYKLTQWVNGKYVLVAKHDGSHYEEYVDRSDAHARMAAEERAYSGTLDGHVPAAPPPPRFILWKTAVLPTGDIPKGTISTEAEWQVVFPALPVGGCVANPEWFRPYPTGSTPTT